MTIIYVWKKYYMLVCWCVSFLQLRIQWQHLTSLKSAVFAVFATTEIGKYYRSGLYLYFIGCKSKKVMEENLTMQIKFWKSLLLFHSEQHKNTENMFLQYAEHITQLSKKSLMSLTNDYNSNICLISVMSYLLSKWKYQPGHLRGSVG